MLLAGQGLPEGADPAEALGGARSIISILEMLQTKSEGNRTPEEAQILDGLLFELRMAYVEKTRGRAVSGPFLAGLLSLAVVLQADAPPAGAPGTAAPAGRLGSHPQAAPAASTASLGDLWTETVSGGQAGDEEGAGASLREIRRLRIERNIASHETIGLGVVARGVVLLDEEDPDAALIAFERAVDLAPGLPDGHYGLSTAHLKTGPLGMVPSIQAMISGLVAFLPTARGAVRATELRIVVGLLAAFLITWVLALTLLLRHGGLLRHDIEEWLGPAQSRSASLALFLLLSLFPLAAFQGWGWLPLWWLAILFPVLRPEREDAGGPRRDWSSRRRSGPRRPRATGGDHPQSPLHGGGGGGGRGTRRPRGESTRGSPAPRPRGTATWPTFSGTRGGARGGSEMRPRSTGACSADDPSDTVARNNLANIEFAGGGYDAALVRYRQGAEAGGRPAVAATSFYNLSLAHLEKFDYQAYNEAKSSADRLAPSLVAGYDRWRFDSGDYAVVDLGLSREEVWRKFAGVAEGVGVRNVFGTHAGGGSGLSPRSLVNRFTGAVLIFVLVALLMSWARGGKAFTVHCSRCGTAFCRQCHLGKVVGELCSQCYHLFVVRDGVSGPVRNRKMLEVQGKETRRARVFRALSIVSPGAGHVYSRQTILGVALVSAWYTLIAILLASRLLPAHRGVFAADAPVGRHPHRGAAGGGLGAGQPDRA